VEGEIYINLNNFIWKFLSKFYFRDTLVPPDWGIKTFDELKKRGIEGDFITLKNTLHELKKNELLDLEKWISEILPPLESDLQNKL
jgi:hypothetical protein